jgi:transcriptional regulator with XRE-family HTH domain
MSRVKLQGFVKRICPWRILLGMAKQPWPDVLRAFAQKEGLTGVQLGTRLGVSQSTASRWRAGIGFPEGSNLTRVASELGIDEGRLAQLIHDAKRRQRETKPERGRLVLAPAVLRDAVELLVATAQSADPTAAAQARDSLAALQEALAAMPPALRRATRSPRA